MEKRFNEFTLKILMLYRYVGAIKNIEMDEFNLKGIHAAILNNLYFNEEITSAELTKEILEDKAAVSRALKELYEKKLIDYVGKKYKAKIILTVAGKEIALNVIEKIDKAVAAGGASLTEEKRIIFYEALEIICKNLGAYYRSLEGNDESIL